MIKIMSFLFIVIFFQGQSLAASKCPDYHGNYGNAKNYQNFACIIMISSDKADTTSYRTINLSQQGQLQVFNSFPGTTNSNSTGSHDYYLLPYRTDENTIVGHDENEISILLRSGVTLTFDKNGRMSSPDLVMKVDDKINSSNQGGIEIQKYKKGLVVDLGWKRGSAPAKDPQTKVKISDKNGVTCTFLNSELHTFSKYDFVLKYKTNEEFYNFLSKKCSQLDLSDFKQPAEIIKKIITKKDNKNVKTINDTDRNKVKATGLDNELKNEFEELNTPGNGVSR
jgi:endogenous inhibitor of DNA gyrase (YacG/DUF329 family)